MYQKLAGVTNHMATAMANTTTTRSVTETFQNGMESQNIVQPTSGGSTCGLPQQESNLKIEDVDYFRS